MNNSMWSDIETIVTGPNGERWLELLYRLDQKLLPEPSEKVMADELIALGLCERNQDDVRLTSVGSKCATSVREYRWWIERDRKFHGEDTQPILRLENFREKVILEIGSGWGCNLVRLRTVAKRIVGLEIEPAYIEMSKILAKREGIEPPEIVVGAAENTPFDNAAFDWVLLWSALQYMDIEKAFREIARLLRPGGYVLTSQILLADFVGRRLQNAIHARNALLLLATASITANTLWYQIFRKRLRNNLIGNSTARPIHPTKHYLIAAAERSGLRFCNDLSVQLGPQFGLVLQKPVTSLSHFSPPASA
jgi:ubiquinone/menaquinone biosynthesis C-methylase UbiE